ncbi:MAG: arabinose efflux permease family protein [Ilumatobacteraceae bacterium]|nr:arabinose efflux permease family protein [Ilumatobacteraceae bacterium]
MLPAGLRPLRHRVFALFWGSGAASDIGTWVQLAAIGSLVAVSSGSALATAMVAAATFLPQGICCPIGGLLADRYERRRTFLVTLGAQAVITTAIAVVIAAGLRNPYALSALVLLQSSAGALGQPSLQAILPDLVPAEDLTAAVALGVTSWNSGRVVGPLVATALVPFGAYWAVAANGISFALLWVAIMCCRRRFVPAANVRFTMRTELVNGMRALRTSRGCTAAVVTIVALHLCVVPFVGLLPSTSRALLQRGGAALTDSSVTSITARLLSAQGIGAIVGSLIVANLVRRFRRSTLLTFALAAAAVLVPAHEFTPGWISTAFVVLAMGSCVAVVQSVLGGVVQRDATLEHRGRILSWYQGLNGLAYGIGLLGLGVLSDRFGLRTTFGVLGFVIVGVVIAARRSSVWADAIDGHHGEGHEQHRDPELPRSIPVGAALA